MMIDENKVYVTKSKLIIIAQTLSQTKKQAKKQTKIFRDTENCKKFRQKNKKIDAQTDLQVATNKDR